MSRNKALLADITDKLTKPSKPKIARNQWQHPGEITNIPSNHITMQGVGFPVLGVPDVGLPQLMHTGQDYHFPGARNVMEYPMMDGGGEMIRRADGSYSQRGLWDNIRANRGSGKKPTKEMLEQERKIKAEFGMELPKAQKGRQVKKDPRDKDNFIDLKKTYGMDIFTPQGMKMAEQLNAQYPGSKFVCTANGCADIAAKAANAYGHDFGRFNAWEAGNQNPVLYSNPVYTQAMIDAKEPLPNPSSFNVPKEMQGMENVMIGLNRANNLVDEKGRRLPTVARYMNLGLTKEKKKSNDSFEYKYNYPGSRGYEHIGYLRGDNTLIHGTAGSHGKPSFLIFDDVRDGVKLPGYGGYEPVEAIGEPGAFTRNANKVKRGAVALTDKAGEMWNKFMSSDEQPAMQQASMMPNMDAVSGLINKGRDLGSKVIDKARRAIPIGESVIDYLGKQGVSYDKATRKAIAQHLGIENYNFSAAKNIELMKRIAAAPEILEKFVPKAQVGLSMGAGAPLMDAYNAVREFIPVNARALGRMGAAAMTGMDTGPFINKKDLNKEQLKAVYNAAMSAQKRTGKSNSGTMYSDYGPEYGNIWGRGMMNVIKDSMFDPTFQTATSLGRFTYNVNPDGSVDVTDKYDFNDEKKGVIKDAVKYMDNKLGNDSRKNVSFRVSPSDFKKKGGSTFSGNAWYEMGGAPCFECGGSLQKYQYAGPTAAAWQLSDEEIVRQANMDLGMTTTMDPLSQTDTLAGAASTVFANDLKTRIAKENPNLSLTKYKPLSQYLGDTTMSLVNAANSYNAAFNKGDAERDRDTMVRNRNAQYNQQGVSFMDRGNYGVGPSDYGLFRPNQMGVKSPEGQYNGGKFFQDGGVLDTSAKYTVPSIDAYFTPDFSGAYATPERLVLETLPSRPVQPLPTNFKTVEKDFETAPQSLKEQIALRESGGNYKALPKKKDGTLASSAAGKYQFLWNSHKNKIAELTGVTNKQEFLNSPDAQERYFDYWNANTLTPTAQKIKKIFQPKQSLDELKMMVHFAGPQGAMNYFAKGQVTRDAFGSTNSSYVNKMEVGGEYELTAEEIMQIKAMGGDVEFV